MKNTAEKKLSKKTLRQLESIAMKADYALECRGGLDDRSNDTEDFPEVSIWGIRKMLEEAYRLGMADARKTAE